MDSALYPFWVKLENQGRLAALQLIRRHRDGAKLLIAKLKTDTRTGLKKIWADGSYLGEPFLTWLTSELQQIQPEIAKTQLARKALSPSQFAGLSRPMGTRPLLGWDAIGA